MEILFSLYKRFLSGNIGVSLLFVLHSQHSLIAVDDLGVVVFRSCFGLPRLLDLAELALHIFSIVPQEECALGIAKAHEPGLVVLLEEQLEDRVNAWQQVLMRSSR